jgi:molybdopterin-containing oxidoreductase family membrane subunit
MALILLTTGLIVGYSYFVEAFMAWYGGNQFEQYMTLNRMFGPYWPVYWGAVFCNVVAIQPLWFKRIRTNALVLFAIALIVNVGMWLERYMIVVTSLHRDFLPSAWGMYYPTIWDIATLVGSIGLFFTLFLLFIRVLPMISIYEMRELVEETSGQESGVRTKNLM